MKKYPIIGISGSVDREIGKYVMRENYFEAVKAAGGIPVLLGQTTDPDVVHAMAAGLDGVLLAGGGDALPSRYGEETIPECGTPDLIRDEFELLLLKEALQRGLPVMGICRGIQMLAVGLGGTLVQDIPAQCGIPRERHMQEEPYGAPIHEVRWTKGGLFEKITGAETMQTNSMHHQSVKDAGPDLVVEGTTADGIIEAVSMKGHPEVFGVQFHPEYLYDHEEKAAKLFRHFISCAQK